MSFSFTKPLSSKSAGALALAACVSSPVTAFAEAGGFNLRPIFGFSSLADTEGVSQGVGGADGSLDLSTDSGFFAGLGVGYEINENVSVEFAWEYRTNDSEATLADGTKFTDGDYASNIFMFNTEYRFPPRGQWQPYVGGGLTWVQEIDIDIEANGNERSFSGDGDTGLQIFAGADYRLSGKWSVNTELRFGKLSSIDLEEEGGSGSIDDLDYDTTSIQIGFRYYF